MAKMQPQKLQAVRGTQDMIGDAAARFERVVDAFNRVAKLYGFRPVQVPVFEHTAVFARTLGETTDVVAKEMYSFADRNGESLTLRPEFTAGICRAFISEGWQQHVPLKLVTHGPLFRYERPQKGRYRQFHQVDAEVIGSAEPAADVELLAFADHLLRELGVADGVTLRLNTLGDAETRAAWRDALVAHFGAHTDALSAESRERLEKNPLRILDSKAPEDRALVEAAPPIDAHMSAEAGAFFERVQRGLQASGVAFARDPRLVRGFDYYRHTAFEFVTDRLGAQGTVIGGGRYDGLIGSMGGPETPAVGWAGGIERLGMMLESSDAKAGGLDFVIVSEDDRSEAFIYKLAADLRQLKKSVEFVNSGSVKKRMEKAVNKNPLSILLVGQKAGGKESFVLEIRRGRASGLHDAQQQANEALETLRKTTVIHSVDIDRLTKSALRIER